MRLATLCLLIGALVLGFAAVPLTVMFMPVGVACCLGSLLLAMLAVPDLSRQDTQDGTLGETYQTQPEA